MTQEDNKSNENSKIVTIKRPSLFVIRAILEDIDRAPQHRARFGNIARFTPELKNRGKLVQYLKLLVNDLLWLEKQEEVHSTARNPRRERRPEKKWTVGWYNITGRGKTFLELFPFPRILEGGDEGVPSPEEQAKNWKEWIGQS